MQFGKSLETTALEWCSQEILISKSHLSITDCWNDWNRVNLDRRYKSLGPTQSHCYQNSRVHNEKALCTVFNERNSGISIKGLIAITWTSCWMHFSDTSHASPPAREVNVCKRSFPDLHKSQVSDPLPCSLSFASSPSLPPPASTQPWISGRSSVAMVIPSLLLLQHDEKGLGATHVIFTFSNACSVVSANISASRQSVPTSPTECE